MQVRQKVHPHVTGSAYALNPADDREMIVFFAAGDSSSERTRDYEGLFTQDGQWHDLQQALRDGLLTATPRFRECRHRPDPIVG